MISWRKRAWSIFTQHLPLRTKLCSCTDGPGGRTIPGAGKGSRNDIQIVFWFNANFSFFLWFFFRRPRSSIARTVLAKRLLNIGNYVRRYYCSRILALWSCRRYIFAFSKIIPTRKTPKPCPLLLSQMARLFMDAGNLLLQVLLLRTPSNTFVFSSRRGRQPFFVAKLTWTLHIRFAQLKNYHNII